MPYIVDCIEPGILALRFSGVASVDERLASLDGVDAAIDGRVALLVDMSEAEIQPYGAGHALMLSDALSLRRPRCTRVAHLMRRGQTDLVATVTACLCPRDYFQRFSLRPAALDWLRRPRD